MATDRMTQSTPKVLFVDDEENVLRSLRRLFVDEEIDVYTASSGREGLNVIDDNKDISVIVSDQRMPEMSGWEFLEKAREIAPDALRIILTGYADVNAAINAINKGGAYRYITKPWNDADLVLVIKDAIEKHRLIAENRYLTELTKKQNEELQMWNSQLEIMVQEQTINIQKQNEQLQKLNEQLQKNFRKSIETFSALVEMRDRTVSSHSKNVAVFARQTAKAMALPDSDVNSIIVAALLHDIGKIGVPDSVLTKQENELSEFEKKEYRLHPVRGQVAVEGLEGFHEIGVLIRHHHENIDGSGYPDGLKKDDIPIGSRIIAMADYADRTANSIFSTVKNNYKKALEEIEFYLDSRFDRHIFTFMKPVLLEKIQAQGNQDLSGDIEMHPARLVPGMVLSRDLRTGTGLLILAQGAVLDQKIISALQRYYRMDPPKTGVFIRKSSVIK